jgi:response regulator RpfG family c-di-GMP phosphodiesterase
MTHAIDKNLAVIGPAASAAAATILIVDDEPHNRRLLEALLRPEGYLTTSVASGEAALASIAERAPDLVLLDIMMPGLDGYHVATAIKANPVTANIPVIMITSQDDHSSRLASLNAGAEEFLNKPVDRAELWIRVRNLLRLKTLGDFLKNHNAILEREVQARTADIRRQSQLFAALSRCNEAIVRCASEEELFPQICRAAVEFGGMAMAWIGLVDPDTRMLRPVASFGHGAEELATAEVSVDADSAFGRGPGGTAIRSNQPYWCQDFLHDPIAAPWCECATRAGWAASATLPLHRHGSVIGAFILYAHEVDAFDGAARNLLVEMAADISFALDNFERESRRRRAEADIRGYVEQLKTSFMSTVRVATTLSEMRDPYTAGHERRVAEIAVAIGAELGFDARRQEGLRVAGHLHDIGKIVIPSEILSKPGNLSKTEFELIQEHVQASYDVLKSVEFPWPVAQIALQHHERMDGSGYPQGLKGEAILLEARIMAVADVVEAMSSHRPYRPALGIDKALAEIERRGGTAFDSAVADACLRLFRQNGYQVPV